jgi:predicted AlkP superfamily phosphohydrolase/phosphomutase
MRASITVALALLLLSNPAGAEDRHPVKVVLLGIDGISMNLLEPLAEKGAIPNLKKLAEQGGWGELDSFWPLRTMQVWTSIVTGKLPGQHGIWDHVKNSYYNPPEYRTKEREIYTPKDRRSKALWQLLSGHKVSSLTVGWPTTWPAEKIEGGIMVAPKVLYGDERRVTIKGSFWRHVNDAVQPSELWPTVKKLTVETQEVTREEMAAFLEVPPQGSPLYALPKIESYVHAVRWSIARARSVEAITLGLAEKEKPQVVLAYFQCTDSLLHRFWIFQKSEEEIKRRLEQLNISTDHVPEMKRRFGRVVEACYRDVDNRVGRILEKLQGSDTLVLAVSDHGFGDGPQKHPFKAEPYGGIHWSVGAMIAAAPNMQASGNLKKASVLDVTPTILHFLGLPVAKDMRGKIIEALFSSEALKKHPVQTIPTYEAEPQMDVPYLKGFPEKPSSFVW